MTPPCRVKAVHGLPEAPVAVLATRVAVTTIQRSFRVHRNDALDEGSRAAQAASSAGASL